MTSPSRHSVATAGHSRNRQSVDVFHHFVRWFQVFETFTLDQLRALITVIEEGSFLVVVCKLYRV